MLSTYVVLAAVCLVTGSVFTWNWLRHCLPRDLEELRDPLLRDEDRWAIRLSWLLHGFLAFATGICLLLLITALIAYLRRLFA